MDRQGNNSLKKDKQRFPTHAKQKRRVLADHASKSTPDIQNSFPRKGKAEQKKISRGQILFCFTFSGWPVQDLLSSVAFSGAAYVSSFFVCWALSCKCCSLLSVFLLPGLFSVTLCLYSSPCFSFLLRSLLRCCIQYPIFLHMILCLLFFGLVFLLLRSLSLLAGLLSVFVCFAFLLLFFLPCLFGLCPRCLPFDSEMGTPSLTTLSRPCRGLWADLGNFRVLRIFFLVASWEGKRKLFLFRNLRSTQYRLETHFRPRRLIRISSLLAQPFSEF